MANKSKHGPNRLSNYKNVHQTIMEQFLREDFVLSENLSFEDLGDGFLTLDGRIECVDNIYIDVFKRLQILDGEGSNAVVQTVDYSYNAAVRGIGSILRYDSPHVDHNQQLHCHRFYVFKRQEILPPIFTEGEQERPTLGEVISEVRDWYFQHLDRLAAQ